MVSRFPLLAAFVIVPAVVTTAAAQQFVRPEFRAARAPQPPVIDGTLDDASWQLPPVPTGEFLSYNPLHGDPVPQKTTVWSALLEQRDFVDGQWVPQQGEFHTTQRGLFFKASYLYRF